MKILLIFTICLISDEGASEEVTGYSGGGVLIKCKYDTGYSQKQKIFCKGSWPNCTFQVKTGAKGYQLTERFSLFDDTKSAEIRVMMRELTVEDTGTYHCGVNIRFRNSSYKLLSVELKVKEDLSYEKSISKNGYVGRDLDIICKYPQSVRSKPKFLCRMKPQSSDCSYKESVKESRTTLNVGKSSLYDDRAKQHLSVSFRNVNKRDSGEYWCGAESVSKSDHGYNVYFTQISLRVTEPQIPVSTSISPKSTSSLTSLSSSSLLSKPTPLASAGFPASTMITVSVVLLLLLIGISILHVILKKRCKMPEGAAFVQDSQNNHVVPLDVCHYEEINNIRRLHAPNPGASTVYSFTKFSIIPCDASQTVYANMLSHTSSHELISATPQLSKDLFDEDIYSTAQLPTRLSDTSVD